MIDPWILAAVALGYIGVLFAIAAFGDRPGRRGLVRGPWVFALSMAVYCTAWTFYGSVGRAASTGIGFLPIYLGPTLAAALAWVLLRKMVRISKRHSITSIADLVAARYGKSRGLGALVTGVVVFGSVPYLALQLKAVAASYLLLVDGGDAGDEAALLRASFAVATVLAAFAILFGTRHLDLTEQHAGMVLAVAFESVVKLVAFLALGAWVVFALYDGPRELFGDALARPDVARLFTFDIGWDSWMWMVFLAWSAILFLPRQFQVGVVECTDEGHLRRASWVLPLYLLLINVFVLPIAVAGRLRFDGAFPPVDADTFVLSLPLAEGQTALALLVFLGGLSAATGMVIVECVALSTMVANDLVLPLVLEPALGDEGADLGRRLLTIRRVAIVGVLLLGQLYLVVVGIGVPLVSIGLVSFAAIAQLTPAIL
ncbi:MAG: histidine kinase, partial [Acidobacteriota bacterium]